MRTALVFIFAFTTALAGKQYLIKTGNLEPEMKSKTNCTKSRMAENDYVSDEGCPTIEPSRPELMECNHKQKGLRCEYGYRTCCSINGPWKSPRMRYFCLDIEGVGEGGCVPWQWKGFSNPNFPHKEEDCPKC